LPSPVGGSTWFKWLAHTAIICLYEAMGTFILVSAVNSTAGNPTAIGLVLFLLLLIAAPISGGHFNPATTLGVFINKDASVAGFINVFFVISAQFVGAVGGMFFIYSLLDNNKDTP